MRWIVRLYNDRTFPDGTRCQDPHTGQNEWPTSDAAVEVMDRLARLTRADSNGHFYRLDWLPAEEAPDMPNDDEDTYVNDECPNECDTEHDTEGHFQCEATGEFFLVCDDCGTNNASRYDSVYWGPDGNGRCESCHYDRFCSCDDCGDYYDRDAGDGHCTEGGCYCNYCYEDQAHVGDGPGATRIRCGVCESYNDHYDEVEERFVCDHLAAELRAAKRPVLVGA